MIGRLLLGWQATLGRLGAGRHPLLAVTAEGLLARWHEPHRHYHDVTHLDTVLSTVDALGGSDVARLAAWYHDAVYQPAAADNEERSARLAVQQLTALAVPADVVDGVAAAVRSTDGHRPGGGDAAVLCDADLAVLASPRPAYRRYRAAVRREYGHLDDEQWRDGRAAVLRDLLDRPALFTTAGGAGWEGVARDNVGAELADLDGPAARARAAG